MMKDEIVETKILNHFSFKIAKCRYTSVKFYKFSFGELFKKNCAEICKFGITFVFREHLLCVCVCILLAEAGLNKIILDWLLIG